MLYVLWDYDIFDNFNAYVHKICKECIQNIIKAELVFKSDAPTKNIALE
jgi:myosin-crossreactive antigen